MGTTPFPMITCTLSITLPAPVVMDLNTTWLQRFGGPIGSLVNAVAAADTTLTLAAAPLGLTPGAALLIDNEPVVVTAINGEALTIERYAAAFPFLAQLPAQPQTAHAAGANVYLLQYSAPWVMIGEVLRAWAQQQVNALGSASATFGSTVTGSLAPAS